MKKHIALALTSLAVSSAVVLSGCTTASSQQGSDSTSNAEQPTPSVDNVQDLKVAYFSAGTSNQYLQAGIDEANRYADEQGFSLDVFDGQFNAQTQFDQMQTALTSGKYNVFAVEPNDGNLVCNLLTRDAPAANITVTVFNLPICGRATNLGEETWEPGTAAYVGGQTIDVYQEWMSQVQKAHPDGAKIALISGPDLNANTISFFKAADELEASDGYEVVARQTTDYTTAQAFEAAQTIIQANPDIDVIMSNFSGMTRGVVQATTGSEVEVFDFGGDSWALDNVKNGVLASTVMMLPRQETKEALQAVVDLVEGESTPKFVDLTKSGALPNGNPFVYADNISEYTAEY